MTTNAILTYVAYASSLSVANLEAKMASFAIDDSYFDILGGSITNDVTTTTGSQGLVSRTITWNLDDASKANFPDSSDQTAPFWDLFSAALSAWVKYPVMNTSVIIQNIT